MGLARSRPRSGGVTLSDTLLHVAQDDLPFGGVGPSGMGAYHGEDGFRSAGCCVDPCGGSSAGCRQPQ